MVTQKPQEGLHMDRALLGKHRQELVAGLVGETSPVFPQLTKMCALSHATFSILAAADTTSAMRTATSSTS